MSIVRKLKTTRFYILENKTAISLIAASLIVVMWTLVRFYDLPTIYDMVSQQLIARSWLHGDHTMIQIGPTNYILKLMFVYVPLQLLPGSARLDIIFSTVAINLATLWLLYILIGRIIRELSPSLKPQLYISMLWLSLAAGSVFWIQFANSRNLEVVGGCFLIERSLQYWRRPSYFNGASIFLFSAVLFFADPLQIYMTALPLVIFLYMQAKKMKLKQVFVIGTLIGAGVIASKLLFRLAALAGNITFIGGSQLNTNWTSIRVIRAVFFSLREVLALVAGRNELGRAYQFLMVFILITGAYLFIRNVKSDSRLYNLAKFVATFIIVDLIIYALSGQSLQPGTSRYLIMIIPALMIIFALSKDTLTIKNLTFRPLATLIITGLAVCFIGLVIVWHPSHDSDGRLSIIRQAIQKNGYSSVYGSMDMALPLDYYLNANSPQIMALACGPDGLIFSLAKPKSAIANIDNNAALIFDGSRIANVPYICSPQTAKAQLGEPIWTEEIADGSQVLIYPNKLLVGVLSR